MKRRNTDDRHVSLQPCAPTGALEHREAAGMRALAARLWARGARRLNSEPRSAMDAVVGLDGVVCAVGEGFDLFAPGPG